MKNFLLTACFALKQDLLSRQKAMQQGVLQLKQTLFPGITELSNITGGFFLQINTSNRIFSQCFRIVLHLSSRDSAVDSYFLQASNQSASSTGVEPQSTPQSKLHPQQCITSEFICMKDNTIDNLQMIIINVK